MLNDRSSELLTNVIIQSGPAVFNAVPHQETKAANDHIRDLHQVLLNDESARNKTTLELIEDLKSVSPKALDSANRVLTLTDPWKYVTWKKYQTQ